MQLGHFVLLSALAAGLILYFIQEWRERADIDFKDRPTRSVLYSISVLWITAFVTGLTAVVFSTELSVRVLGAMSSAALGFLLVLAGWQVRRRRRISRLTAALATIPLALAFWAVL